MSLKGRSVVLSVLWIMSGLVANAQSALAPVPRPGEAAPELKLERILQARPDTNIDWKNLSGRVVVIDFWATWCAPCLTLQPHLNQLAERFKDQPVSFIAITDEPETIVSRFLRRRPINGWVGIDTSHSSMSAYGVTTLPRTFVVDQGGRIAAVFAGSKDGESLTETMLAQLVSKSGDRSNTSKPITQAGPSVLTSPGPPRTDPGIPPGTADEDELLDITIRNSKFVPSPTNPPRTSMMPGVFTARGVDFQTLLQELLKENPRAPRFPKSRIFAPVDLLERKFDITAVAVQQKAPALSLLVVSSLETTLSLTISRVKRVTDVYVLTAPRQLADGLRPSQVSAIRSSQDHGTLAATGMKIDVLASFIEETLGVPIINETKLDGNFDWDVVYDGKNPKSIIDAIRKDLGLELTPAKREVELVVVEKR